MLVAWSVTRCACSGRHSSFMSSAWKVASRRSVMSRRNHLARRQEITSQSIGPRREPSMAPRRHLTIRAITAGMVSKPRGSSSGSTGRLSCVGSYARTPHSRARACTKSCGAPINAYSRRTNGLVALGKACFTSASIHIRGARSIRAMSARACALSVVARAPQCFLNPVITRGRCLLIQSSRMPSRASWMKNSAHLYATLCAEGEGTARPGVP
eukprot:gene3219-biopygen6666